MELATSVRIVWPKVWCYFIGSKITTSLLLHGSTLFSFFKSWRREDRTRFERELLFHLHGSTLYPTIPLRLVGCKETKRKPPWSHQFWLQNIVRNDIFPPVFFLQHFPDRQNLAILHDWSKYYLTHSYLCKDDQIGVFQLSRVLTEKSALCRSESCLLEKMTWSQNHFYGFCLAVSATLTLQK